MKLFASTFSAPFKTLPGYTPVSPRLFANGRELDPETAIIVSDLPPHLLEDIGVTDRVAPAKQMDKPRIA